METTASYTSAAVAGQQIFLRVNKSHSDDLLILFWHPSSLDYRGDVCGILGRTRVGQEVRLSLI